MHEEPAFIAPSRRIKIFLLVMIIIATFVGVALMTYGLLPRTSARIGIEIEGAFSLLVIYGICTYRRRRD